jgi:hypothetical protein
MAEDKKTKGNGSGAAVAVIGAAAAGLGIAVYLSTRSKAGPTLAIYPTSGPQGSLVSAIGTDWSPTDAIIDVSVSGVSAANTLAIGADGKISGTFTIPELSSGVKDLSIATTSGTKIFKGVFTVTGQGAGIYTLMPVSSGPTTIAVSLAQGANQWVAMPVSSGPTTIAVSLAQGANQWVAMPVSSGPTTIAVSLTILTPQLQVSPTVLKSGDVLSFTFYNFTPMASVGVSVVGGGGLNVTANALGSGTGSFVLNATPGVHTLEAQDNYGRSATADFTVQSGATTVLTVGANNDNYGFVEVNVNGTTQPSAGTYNIPVGARVILTAYPLGNYQFSTWWDSTGQYTGQNTNPIIIGTWANARGFVATFVTAPPPPPPGGPTFPAPGTFGDGLYWYWVKFTDSSIGWDDTEDVIGNPAVAQIIAGPYPSGATS